MEIGLFQHPASQGHALVDDKTLVDMAASENMNLIEKRALFEFGKIENEPVDHLAVTDRFQRLFHHIEGERKFGTSDIFSQRKEGIDRPERPQVAAHFETVQRTVFLDDLSDERAYFDQRIPKPIGLMHPQKRAAVGKVKLHMAQSLNWLQ
jgi:hypothetical protein